jgi:phosphoribosyl 1,2-cyclic phosphate phosphodiesterase
MSLTVTVLGCGSSGGVPRLGQGWGACNPEDPRNRRTRCSILLERTGQDGATTNVLVDMSPDLREQLLRSGTDRLDAVVLTHPHADHTHGIDDVRPLVIHMRSRIPVYMDEPTWQVVGHNFSYIFETPPGSMYPPLLDRHVITPHRDVTIVGPGGPISITPFLVDHGEIPALGLRVGTFVYLPDVKRIPPDAMPVLSGLSVLMIDALRYTGHPSHISVAEALDWIERLQPDRAVLTNLHTDLDYERLASELPTHVVPAFDGLRLPLA